MRIKLLQLAWRRPIGVRTAATKKAPPKEMSFSKSGAYFGADKKRTERSPYELNTPLYIPSYYDTPEWQNRRLAVVCASLAIFFIYFGLLREPNDIDVILNAPPHVLSGNLERRLLREQIEEAKRAGRSTELLEAQLEYVDVKEAAVKAQFTKQKL
ncbi:hypothetical protein M3Y99_00071100 [Aphelenchoides fujianensis]|nr:hypothetical protein M3Y99_00071100 [Aphelenchoides fujianensis]